MPAGALNLAGFTDDAAENIHENRRRFLALDRRPLAQNPAAAPTMTGER